MLTIYRNKENAAVKTANFDDIAISVQIRRLRREYGRRLRNYVRIKKRKCPFLSVIFGLLKH